MDTELTVYNTLSRTKEKFVPIKGNKVSMFVCGQTVYDDAHLGHAKSYINFDIIARWLRHIGYGLTYIQNITDIEDKIITRAKESGKDPVELARYYEKRFMEDMKSIGVTASVNEYPRSHDYISVMKDQIQLLIDKGYAYCLDGDVYYDVAKFKDYTKLSGMKLEELEKHRIEPKEGKHNTFDFALWKNSKHDEPSWKINVREKGKAIALNGRPGWHIEDTAITYHFFGPQYDIHGGATELIFPHHTNEIAQAEAAYNVKPFVRYWVHTGIMRIKGEKMSKSTRNFIRIRELLKAYEPEALRLLVSSTHYSKDIDYTDGLIKNAQKRLRYIYSSLSLFYNSDDADDDDNDKHVRKIIENVDDSFAKAMNDDFNTPLALSHLSNTIDELRSFIEIKGAVSKGAKEHIINEIVTLGSVLGILQKSEFKTAIPAEVISLIKEREKFRKSGNYEEADRLRNRLRKEHSIILEDSQYGTLWYKET